jgi:hypothetical protein
MSEESTPSSCYCITGHGRSGTSFVTEMLQSAGLDVGERLMGPCESNPHGHFEDMDFHEFHVAVLTSLGYGIEGYILEPAIRVPEQFVGPARSMVESRRRAGRPWGWKEPRSTLLLDFWRGLVPELRFLLLFRRPWDVLDSLFRRGDPTFQKNPNFAVQVWLNYNRSLLNFYDRFPDRCLLIESRAAAADPARLTDAIAARFGDRLGTIKNVYEDDLFRHEPSSRRRSVLGHFFPEAVTLFEQLRERADLFEEHGESGPVPADLDWALQDWLDLRHSQARSRGILRHVQSQLEESQRRALAGLDRLNAELERLNQVIAHHQAHLAWVESSKFWKLRGLWVGMRSRLTRPGGPPDLAGASTFGGRIDEGRPGVVSRFRSSLRGAIRGRAGNSTRAEITRHR